jgi:cytochrome c
VAVATVPVASQEAPTEFNIGQPATQEQIRAWDVDVTPSGRGLPPGSGTARQGASIYAAQCAGCHGDQGQGGRADRLVNTEPFMPGVPRTIGNYWPYATTVWDYINRAMPFQEPGTLQPGEVYAVTAWLLHMNGIITDDFVLNAQTLPRIQMPARDIFVPDPRPDEL